MFISQFKEGYLVEGDASQLEWKVAAYLSQCPTMIEEILNGVDQHQKVREELFNNKVDRVIAKIYNFRMIYGGSPYSFFRDIKMPNYSLKKWEEINKAFYEKYSGLKRWHDELYRDIYRNNGEMKNITGRLFKLDKFETRNGMEYRFPQVVNYPVQSLATADIIPLAMVEIRKKLLHLYPNRGRMVLQVHDSVLYDVENREVADEVAKVMLNTFDQLPKLFEKYFNVPFNVPLGGEVKMGKNWLEMVKI